MSLSSVAKHEETQPLITIFDDDMDMRALLSLWLQKANYRTQEIASFEYFLNHIEEEKPQVVILDLVMPNVHGLDVLKLLQQAKLNLSVIVLTASNQAQDAFQAVKLGAYDYLVKPVEKERLLASIRNAVERNQLLDKVKQFETETQDSYPFHNIVATSAVMERVFDDVKKVANSSIPIYLFGESGTGKELIAKAIHKSSPRKNEPFIPINCAAIPKELIESEFFGHEKGAFTGAHNTRKGCFEQAHKGTLFLDEVGEMDLSTQVKLLRVLQEHTLTRVGGTKSIDVDVRIICATNKDLEKLTQEGLFREDLFYRLTGFTIHLPSLRKRKEDIPLLVQYFLKKYNVESNNPITGVSPSAMDVFTRYPWPGNIRELENTIHSLIITVDSDVIEEYHLPSRILQPKTSSSSSSFGAISSVIPKFSFSSLLLPSQEESDVITPIKDLEKREILKAMRITKGKVEDAAQKLGIGRATLYRKLSQYEYIDEEPKE